MLGEAAHGPDGNPSQLASGFGQAPEQGVGRRPGELCPWGRGCNSCLRAFQAAIVRNEKKAQRQVSGDGGKDKDRDRGILSPPDGFARGQDQPIDARVVDGARRAGFSDDQAKPHDQFGPIFFKPGFFKPGFAFSEGIKGIKAIKARRASPGSRVAGGAGRGVCPSAGRAIRPPAGGGPGRRSGNAGAAERRRGKPRGRCKTGRRTSRDGQTGAARRADGRRTPPARPGVRASRSAYSASVSFTHR